VLIKLLDEDPPYGIRTRVLHLLRNQRCLDIYENAVHIGNRGLVERPVLVDGVNRLVGNDPVDAQIAIAIRSIDAYERYSALFGAAFDLTLWALRAADGVASSQRVLQTGPARSLLEQWRGRLATLAPQLRNLLPQVTGSGPFEDQEIPSLLSRAFDDAEHATASAEVFLEVVMGRHEQVQRQKRKPVWIDRSRSWTLMPGTPVDHELRREVPAAFIHPYRVMNAYSLMFDLKVVKGLRSDGEDDGE